DRDECDRQRCLRPTSEFAQNARPSSRRSTDRQPIRSGEAVAEPRVGQTGQHTLGLSSSRLTRRRDSTTAGSAAIRAYLSGRRPLARSPGAYDWPSLQVAGAQTTLGTVMAGQLTGGGSALPIQGR